MKRTSVPAVRGIHSLRKILRIGWEDLGNLLSAGALKNVSSPDGGVEEWAWTVDSVRQIALNRHAAKKAWADRMRDKSLADLDALERSFRKRWK